MSTTVLQGPNQKEYANTFCIEQTGIPHNYER